MTEPSSPRPARPITEEEMFLLLEDIVRVGIHVRDQLHILNTHLAASPFALPVQPNGQAIEEKETDIVVQ